MEFNDLLLVEVPHTSSSTAQTQYRCMTLELAYVGKEFERYTNNFGYEGTGTPVANAFSHWTYETFKDEAYPLVVNDLQGAGG